MRMWSVSPTLTKSQAWQHAPVIPELVTEVESLGTHWPGSLTESLSSRLSGRSCPQK